jgi:hypothetical protein
LIGWRAFRCPGHRALQSFRHDIDARLEQEPKAKHEGRDSTEHQRHEDVVGSAGSKQLID